jgi:hypothetical protein
MIQQYTVEHYERQQELLGKQSTSLYDSKDIYIEVDDDDKSEVSKLLALSRYGVTVRLSTPEEIHYVWEVEVELEWGDPDFVRHWPEEEAEIIMQIKDW